MIRLNIADVRERQPLCLLKLGPLKGTQHSSSLARNVNPPKAWSGTEGIQIQFKQASLMAAARQCGAKTLREYPG